MREILFRGKRLDNGEWVYGNLSIRIDGETTIYDRPSGNGLVCSVGRCVIPESVGQYTGLTDKNGKKIFEGDILKSTCGMNYSVEWDKENARFLGFTIGKERYIAYVGREPKSEIIGNIHDNPELLKGADDERKQINKPTNIPT